MYFIDFPDDFNMPHHVVAESILAPVHGVDASMHYVPPAPIYAPAELESSFLQTSLPTSAGSPFLRITTASASVLD